MVQIKFIRQGSNSALGGFSSGDTARVSEAMAKHLVEEAMVAKYLDAPSAYQVIDSVFEKMKKKIADDIESGNAPVKKRGRKPA